MNINSKSNQITEMALTNLKICFPSFRNFFGRLNDQSLALICHEIITVLHHHNAYLCDAAVHVVSSVQWCAKVMRTPNDRLLGLIYA